MPIHDHFFQRAILTRKVGHTDLVFGVPSGFISRSVHRRLQVCVRWLLGTICSTWANIRISDIFTPPVLGPRPQLSVLNDQILHKVCTLCMKLGDLILRKIYKFLATGCQILRPKCTKFNFLISE